MIRPNLLAWQWSDYPAKHRDRVNLVLHLVAVPLFLAGTLLLVAAALQRSGLGVVPPRSRARSTSRAASWSSSGSRSRASS